MGKPSGGGTNTGASIFTTNVSGPTPGPLTVGTNEWIDLGVIPTGHYIRFGSAQYGSPDKSVTFQVRTSNAGQSTGSDTLTTLLASSIASVKTGLLNVDYYKSNTLNIKTVVSTGVEHFWLRLKSTSSTAASYMYSINYTVI